MAKKSTGRRPTEDATLANTDVLTATETEQHPDQSGSGDNQRELPCLLDGERVDGIHSQDGTRIYADVCGDSGPTVFFIHGWTCNGTIWRYQKAHFSDKYRVVSMDLRGHGRSAMPESKDLSTERIAEDIQAVVETFNPKEFAIVCHSLGGFSTLKWHEHFGEQHRGKIKGIVLTDSTGVDVVEGLVGGKVINLFYPIPIAWYLNLYKREIRLFQKISDLVGKSRLGYMIIRYLAFGKNPPANEVDFHRKMTFATSLSSISLAAKTCLDYHVDYHLCNVDVPVFVIAGSRDKLTNKHSNKRTCELLPDSKLKIYKSIGHVPMMECPEELNRDIEEFLEECFA